MPKYTAQEMFDKICDDIERVKLTTNENVTEINKNNKYFNAEITTLKLKNTYLEGKCDCLQKQIDDMFTLIEQLVVNQVKMMDIIQGEPNDRQNK